MRRRGCGIVKRSCSHLWPFISQKEALRAGGEVLTVGVVAVSCGGGCRKTSLAWSPQKARSVFYQVVYFRAFFITEASNFCSIESTLRQDKLFVVTFAVAVATLPTAGSDAQEVAVRTLGSQKGRLHSVMGGRYRLSDVVVAVF